MGRFSTTQEVEILKDGSKLIVLKMEGYIQLDTVKNMEKQILDCMEAGARYLALDFSGVRLINSTGLGILVKVQDIYQSDDREIVLIELDETIGGLLDTLGISGIFRRFPTKKEVIWEFGGAVDSPPSSTPAVDSEERSAAETQPIKLKSAPPPASSVSTKETRRIHAPAEDSPLHSFFSGVSASQPSSAAEKPKKATAKEPVSPRAELPKASPDKISVVETSKRSSESRDYSTEMRTLQTRKLATQRRPKVPIECDVRIDYYSTMYCRQVYPIEMTFALAPAVASVIEEDVPLEIMALFPGCLVTPSTRKMEVGGKKQLQFEVIPLVPGKVDARFEIYTASNKMQNIKFLVQIVTKPLNNLQTALSAVSIIFLGVVLSGFELASGESSRVAHLLHLCGGVLWVSLAVAALYSAVRTALFFKGAKPRKDFCELLLNLPA